jgi:glucosamine--fructose-6-phosphate aminotransferase (isomerizing)
MNEIGAQTILVSDNCIDKVNSTILLETGIKTHPILEPIIIINNFYLMVNKLAISLGYNPDSPVNLKKVTETI